MNFSAVKSEAEHTTRGLVATFDSFLAMFQDTRRQLDNK